MTLQELKSDICMAIDAIEQLFSSFDVPEEDRDRILNTVVGDLYIPAIKDATLNSLSYLFWGEMPGTNRDRRGRRTNYNSISAKRKRSPDEESYMFKFSNRNEVEDVLERLEDCLRKYGQVTVRYLYELLDESGDFETEYYGWKDLSDTKIVRGRGTGVYILELPIPVRLKE